MNIPQHLRRLVLSDGDPATCTGYLVRRHDGGLGVVRHRLEGHGLDEPLPVRAPLVRLEHDEKTAAEAVPLLGHQIAASGFWRGEKLGISSLHRTTSAGPSMADASGPRVLDIEPASPAARAVEGPLFKSGAMLRRFRRSTADGRTEVVVSATEVVAVRAALQPIYGSELRVYESPWTLEEIETLDEAIENIDPRRLASVTAQASTTGAVSRHVDLTFLDEELADRLRLFSSDLLSIDVVVSPTATTS